MSAIHSQRSPLVRPIKMARGNVTACMRCRQRKKRCDQKLPACSACASARVECVSYDAATQRNIPRSFVYALETRVAFLEQKLHQHGIQDTHQGNESVTDDTAILPELVDPELTGTAIISRRIQTESPLSTHRPPPAEAAAEVEATMSHVRQLNQQDATQPRPSHDYAVSRALLSELMKFDGPNAQAGPVEKPLATEESHILASLAENLEFQPAPLPDKRTAEYFVKAYFDFADFSLPLLHEPSFRIGLDSLYAEDVALLDPSHNAQLRLASFFANMVFAIGLLALQKQDASKISITLCDRYCRTALRKLDDTTLPDDVEGVQALLLLAQYSYLHPYDQGGWDTVGFALRRAVKLGLHLDPPPGSMDPLALDTVRRTFWVAYAMDRNLAVATGRPPYVSDGAITAQYPSSERDENISVDGIHTQMPNPSKKRYSLHFFRYRRLQSEMLTILHEQPPFSLAPINYDQWQGNMFNRIKKWYHDVLQESNPPDADQSNISPPEVLELTFNRAVVFLYRPSLMIPSPSPEALRSLSDSAVRVIKLYKRFYRENKLRLFWQAVKNLFNAATALMYCYVNSAQVRAQLSPRSVESLINCSSNILWGMVERSPTLKKKRDEFDIIASKFLADLNSSGRTARTGGPSPLSSEDSPYGTTGFQVDAMNGVAFDRREGNSETIIPPTAEAMSSHPLNSIIFETEKDAEMSGQSQHEGQQGPSTNLFEVLGHDAQMYNGSDEPNITWEDFNVGTLSTMPTWDWET